jgi:HKD family nuclease
MHLLYSNILPLGTESGQNTIIDCFNEQMTKADRVEIAVGYTSATSIDELEHLVDQNNIKSIRLTIGMYYVEGMPESAYHVALKLNQKWRAAGIGEIRIVKAFKYHGKVYCFYKDGEPISAIIGSANLGAIKLEATNRRQYELSAITTDANEVSEIAAHIDRINQPIISANIAEIKGMPLIREKNTALNGIELVTSVPPSNVDFYKRCQSNVSFSLQLKVPKSDERHMDDGKHFTKSNINVCYAAPRSKRKARDWFETQLTVGAEVYHMEGYPEKNKPFFVVTDDGYWFKAHTTSDNNKQFSAVGDELIMGRWLKGRLVAAGIVKPINNTAEDTDRKGMITKEMLEEYGCDRLLFKKTGQTALDSDGTPLDVWMLSFVGNDDEQG